MRTMAAIKNTFVDVYMVVPIVGAVCEGVNELERAWVDHENAAKPPIMERPGWSLTRHVQESSLER